MTSVTSHCPRSSVMSLVACHRSSLSTRGHNFVPLCPALSYVRSVINRRVLSA